MTSGNPGDESVQARRPRDAAATKDAIRRAALEAFTRSGYDGVGLREIAGAAGVDPRLIGRYFGSKEELFARTLEDTTTSRPMVPPLAEDAAGRLLTEPRSETYLNGFLMTIRSTSNPQVVEMLRDVIERHGVSALADALTGPQRHGRATLLIAINLGILLMKDILGANALTGDEAAELVPYLDAALAAVAAPDGSPAAGSGTAPAG